MCVILCVCVSLLLEIGDYDVWGSARFLTLNFFLIRD